MFEIQNPPPFSKMKREASLVSHAILFWNDLPMVIRLNVNQYEYKKDLKHFFMNNGNQNGYAAFFMSCTHSQCSVTSKYLLTTVSLEANGRLAGTQST